MAYAAGVSLMHTIYRFLETPYFHIAENSSPEMIKLLDQECDSLVNVVQGLDSNTKRFSSKRLNALDAQIRDAVFKLEDVLEYHLLHQFLSQSQIHQHPYLFCLDIEELKQDIDSLIETVNKLKAEYIYELSSNNNLPIYDEEEEEEEEHDAEEEKEEVVVKSESRMFGLSNQFLMEIKDRMFVTTVGVHVFGLWGMAGVGKTTLARKLFEDPSVSSHYGSRAFVTVGPEYQMEDVYLDILKQLDPESIGDEEIIMLLEGGDHQEKLGGLTRRLDECLMNRKCLIVLDDAWDMYMLALECIGHKNDGTGSYILLTSRLQNVAIFWPQWEMPLLGKKDSWDLLCSKVFGEDESLCPSQLKKAGRKIAEKCEGLPLTIVKVANILSKLERTPELWNKVAANKQHSVYVKAYAQMHKVLLPSYYCLPQHLRISFLYMGLFPQNYEIPCTKLFMLWTAEGFIQLSKHSVDLYIFTELLSNSVLIVHNRSSRGACATVSLHSSFWYLCKKEAGKSKFFHSFTTLDDCLPHGIETMRRLCIYNPVLFAIRYAFDIMASVSAARSLLCTGVFHQYPVPLCLGSRLLRVLDALKIHFYEFPMEVLRLIHLAYFALTCDGGLPASISKLWNLKYLIVNRYLSIKSSVGIPSYLPVEIWDMKLLEHLQVMGSDLPEPPRGYLMKLYKLLDVSPHSCTQRILERLPYLRKLGIRIELSPNDDAHQPLGCLDHMNELRSFKCVVVNPRIMFEVGAPPPILLPVFPQYLLRLTLSGLGYPWEEMSKISSLPHLRVLKLLSYAFRGPKLDVHDNEFQCLEFLVIEETDLVQWTIKDDYRIQNLRSLSIKHCYKLKEIPTNFSVFLEKVELVDCNPLVLSSAITLKQDWDKKYKGNECGLDLSVHYSHMG